MSEPILLAKNAAAECMLLPEMANRHGLVTGATGTGKTVTLQTLAEAFSQRGVPVFLADVKGDLTGITQAGHGEPETGCLAQGSAASSRRLRPPARRHCGTSTPMPALAPPWATRCAPP